MRLTHRTVLSTAVRFLVVGFARRRGRAGLRPLTRQSPAAATLAELALVAVLFTDGMRSAGRTCTRRDGCQPHPGPGMAS
jgi:hypothetical protein